MDIQEAGRCLGKYVSVNITGILTGVEKSAKGYRAKIEVDGWSTYADLKSVDSMDKEKEVG